LNCLMKKYELVRPGLSGSSTFALLIPDDIVLSDLPEPINSLEDIGGVYVSVFRDPRPKMVLASKTSSLRRSPSNLRTACSELNLTVCRGFLDTATATSTSSGSAGGGVRSLGGGER